MKQAAELLRQALGQLARPSRTTLTLPRAPPQAGTGVGADGFTGSAGAPGRKRRAGCRRVERGWKSSAERKAGVGEQPPSWATRRRPRWALPAPASAPRCQRRSPPQSAREGRSTEQSPRSRLCPPPKTGAREAGSLPTFSSALDWQLRDGCLFARGSDKPSAVVPATTDKATVTSAAAPTAAPTTPASAVLTATSTPQATPDASIGAQTPEVTAPTASASAASTASTTNATSATPQATSATSPAPTRLRRLTDGAVAAQCLTTAPKWVRSAAVAARFIVFSAAWEHWPA